MYNKIIFIMIFYSHFVFGQNVIETKRIELSPAFKETFEELKLYKDSGLFLKIKILEKGLTQVKNGYEQYRIITALGYLYGSAKQYDKSVDMWVSSSKQGMFFPFELKNDKEFPQNIPEFSNNAKFQNFMVLNDSLRNGAVENSKTEYFVNLPKNYNPATKYPLIILLHGGVGDNNSMYINWDSKKLKNDFISVYPQGRNIVGSYARRYGQTGIEDIKEIYGQVKTKYPVDTSKIILAGQSLGGQMSLRLTYSDISACGLLLAFPVKHRDFDNAKANEIKNKNIKIVMICGEKDKSFFPGQQEMSIILDSAKVENLFIKYPDLGHGFPNDFSEQIDKGLLYLTENER